MGLFVVALDGRELNVIEVSVDPDHLDDDIGHYAIITTKPTATNRTSLGTSIAKSNA